MTDTPPTTDITVLRTQLASELAEQRTGGATTHPDTGLPAYEAARPSWEYVQFHRGWWATDCDIRFPSICVRAAGDGYEFWWEFVIRQVRDLGLRIEIFDESWRAFTQRPDLFRELAGLGAQAAIPDVVGVLDRLGFTDVTPQTRL